MPEELIERPKGSSKRGYAEAISAIDMDPYNSEVWKGVLSLARSEEGTEKARAGFYGHIPLDEMIKTAERLKEARTLEDKYRILGEKCSTGELWYGVVLGRVNDKLSRVMGEEMGVWKNRLGEYSGKRKWRKALDIGSGTGNSLRETQKYAEQAIGIDRLSFLLQTGRVSPDLKETPVVTADALKLPFPDEAFDLVSSSGLTFYLSKDRLPQFVNEVSRVLESGGSYFQSYSTPPGENVVPLIEREYLTSGKGVIACLMDRLVTHQYAEDEEGPSEFSVLCSAFKDRGFTRKVAIHQTEGVVVLEFKKKFPKTIEDIRTFYLMGETKRSQKVVGRLIYGDEAREYFPRSKYSKKNIIADNMLPQKSELMKTLESVGKLAAEQELIEKNSVIEYLGVFVDPLVDLAISDVLDPETKGMTLKIISGNLERLYEGRVQKHDLVDWEAESSLKYLKRLRERLKDKPGRGGTISRIDLIISKVS